MRPETKLSFNDKWCPFTRNRTVGWGDENLALAGVNRDDENDNPSWARCIGPRCMMFRGDEESYEHSAQVGPERHPEHCGLVTMNITMNT